MLHRLLLRRKRNEEALHMALVRIACHDWNKGEIFDWYRRQPHTAISKLELRKERDRFKNEYIIIYLDNGWYHRIERRPIKSGNMETISKYGCEAVDGLTPVSDEDLKVIHSETDAEITLEFPSNKPDLYNVIAVAVAIHLDPRTRHYTLQQYNCYFFARSIIALITRHCLLHAPLLTGPRWDRATESAIFDNIFGGRYNKLELDDLLWDIFKKDAGMRIENNRDRDLLQDIVRRVIHEEVERSSAALQIHDMQRAATKWLMDVTRATLWHENFLSDLRYTDQLGTDAMNVVIHLARNISEVLRDVLPKRLINNIPEDFSDRIRETMRQNGKELKQKLLQMGGGLPATVIRVSVRAKLRKATDKELLRHEDLQDHILRMNRVHSKMVAQVPLLGMSEERVYEGLHQKMEDIWQVVCLYPSMPGHS